MSPVRNPWPPIWIAPKRWRLPRPTPKGRRLSGTCTAGCLPSHLLTGWSKGGALGRIYHSRAAYLQSWGGPDTPLLWRFQGDVAGSGCPR